MQKKIAVGIVVALLVAAGIYFVMQGSSISTSTSSNSSATSSSADMSESTVDQQSAGATITYTASGFSPETVTVKSGDTIVIKNESTNNLQFDSDPHPIHTDNPELNVELVGPGKDMAFTVSEIGTFGYHNHLNPAQAGTIVVE